MIGITPNWHPVFVHFPIAFASASVFFFVAGKLFPMKTWAVQCLLVGRWMLWSAVIFACITAIFGWFAYNSVAHDGASHAAMIVHRNWALGALVALLALAAWDVWRGRSGRMPSPGFLVLLVAAWLLVMSAAWFGGELVYRHGLGVMSLPKAEEAGHANDHGKAHGDMPRQGEVTLHEEAHSDGSDDIVNGAHSHDTESAGRNKF